MPKTMLISYSLGPSWVNPILILMMRYLSVEKFPIAASRQKAQTLTYQ